MDQYKLRWEEQSQNASESMPLGGHSVGCNVWVERNDLLVYFQQSGGFDENGSMLKQGRVRIACSPNPFTQSFLQELVLGDGYIHIEGDAAEGHLAITLWVDVARPVIHLQFVAGYEFSLSVSYETWRHADRAVDSQSYELFQCKEVWGDPVRPVTLYRDHVEVTAQDEITFYHRNHNEDLSFDREMDAQGLRDHKAGLFNPQRNLTTGGLMKMAGMRYVTNQAGRYADTDFVGYRFESIKPGARQDIAIYLLTDQADAIEDWRAAVQDLIMKSEGQEQRDFERSREWWRAYWAKSFILINANHPDAEDPFWQIGRNYQLFRYMLGCNASGLWPTKFNGGLFTFDPVFVAENPWSNSRLPYTPDFRLWGGGSHTAQNQRLVYWPMLKSGDFQMLSQIFNFYNRILQTARTRTQVHWGIDGAVYPEQIGIYGLCPTIDHGWGNTTGLPVPQIRYHFSTQLEIALMVLEYESFTGEDISAFVDFIDQVVVFYDGFYPNDDDQGKMIMDPANALETYHVVRNPIDAIAGLDCVLRRMLALPEKYATPERRANWRRILDRVPPIKFVVKHDQQIIAYADTTSEPHNCEIPELYAVFPYGQYGTGKPDLQIGVNTARYAAITEDQTNHFMSWHQQGIHYARLGMLPEAVDFLNKKMGNASSRVPVYWGPGHDWTPDHNWGGSGMIQLQEMLLQTNGDAIYLFPCWPTHVNVSFRLYAPKNTVVECSLQEGKITTLKVLPADREKDVVILLSKASSR